jgi:hypothetical protein
MQQPSSQSDSSQTAPGLVPSRRERLRLGGFRFVRTPHGRSTAWVSLELAEGEVFEGEAAGLSNSMVDLRIAAEATLVALRRFADGRLGLDLIGVKAVRAFDASVIIVSVGVPFGHHARRLLGSSLVEDDPVRGAVLAVLNATNRVIGNLISTS